ncbi:hypothetical protein ElyMa_006589900 [Elysia marginata]|uniref:Uncharacterized protein n=1 Tax=Elysia marginata TaxID=1093978 RepID=A0AAV4IHW1_9GAST|nr:hypothetical protein ElyMa_006589900 [Elysia marginata]
MLAYLGPLAWQGLVRERGRAGQEFADPKHFNCTVVVSHPLGCSAYTIDKQLAHPVPQQVVQSSGGGGHFAATFLGHVMRREKLEHLITTGKLDGKRGRGKQREKMMDGLKRWLGSGSSTETMTAMGHRELWRNMIADASKHGTG